MSRPLVSVVVATHDRPAELAMCLASYACQTFRDFEVIVVHEPSKLRRESKRVVRRMGDKRFRWVEYPKREDDFGSRAKDFGGKEVARGWVIQHQNGDNYVTPVFLDRMVAPFHKGATFTYCERLGRGTTPVHINEDGSIQRMRGSLEQLYMIIPADMARSGIAYNGIDGSSWLCDAEIVRRTPWDIKDGLLADYRLAVALYEQSKPVKVDEVLWVHN